MVSPRTSDMIKKVATVGLGVTAGAGVNYFWEAMKLPGYAVDVFPTPYGFKVGVDDIGTAIISGGVLAYGFRKKNTTYKLLGGGMLLGLVATKILEAQGAFITPASSFGAQAFRVATNLSAPQSTVIDAHTQITKGRYTIG